MSPSIIRIIQIVFPFSRTTRRYPKQMKWTNHQQQQIGLLHGINGVCVFEWQSIAPNSYPRNQPEEFRPCFCCRAAQYESTLIHIRSIENQFLIRTIRYSDFGITRSLPLLLLLRHIIFRTYNLIMASKNPVVPRTELGDEGRREQISSWNFMYITITTHWNGEHMRFGDIYSFLPLYIGIHIARWCPLTRIHFSIHWLFLFCYASV